MSPYLYIGQITDVFHVWSNFYISQMALFSFCNFIFGSSSCTVNDSAGIISVPGSVFFLSLSFACNTSSLFAVPMNLCSV